MGAARSYRVRDVDAGMRLDVLCAEKAFYESRSSAVKAIESGAVLVNGAPASKKVLVSEGDFIIYEFPDVAVNTSLTGEPIPLDIRYEDDDLLVLSKPIGLLTHPTHFTLSHTLVNALIYHCGVDHLCNVQGEDDRLGIVHRLDRDTSGLMLAAKNNETGCALMEDIQARAVDRRYLSLVHGIIAPDTGMIDAPIARDATDRTRMSIRDTSSARDAVTSFRVLERFSAEPRDDGYTLIECKLFTGRTHQIRVHLQYIHHPLVGDPVYTSHGPKSVSAQLGLRRQFLHSWHLAFEHPVSGTPLVFHDGFPKDLQEALEALRARSLGLTEAGKEVQVVLQEAPKPTIEGSLDD